MANEILSKYGSSTAITCTIASLANGSARQSDQVTDASPSAPKVAVYYYITTGTSPTASSVIEFYISRADDNGTEHADGATGTSDAAYSGDLNTLQFVKNQIVTSTSDTGYKGSFIVDEPGTDWRVVIKNSTGAALNATSGNHWLRYRSIIPEVQ